MTAINPEIVQLACDTACRVYLHWRVFLEVLQQTCLPTSNISFYCNLVKGSKKQECIYYYEEKQEVS